MIRNREARVLAVLATVVFCLPTALRASGMDARLVAELTASLDAFAKRNELSAIQMESLLGEIVLNDPKVAQGGIGVVTKDVFVVLREAKNAVVVAGRKWQGMASTESEVVLTDGRKVLVSLHDSDISNLIILVFSPTEVRFIDLSRGAGGRYIR